MEMAEERIAERIDANLLNISTDDLHSLNKKLFSDKIQKLKEATTGRLVIKEYPTASVECWIYFKTLINELSLKKTFKNQILCLLITSISVLVHVSNLIANVNSYTYVKAIAEELRGLVCRIQLTYYDSDTNYKNWFRVYRCWI